jgi:sec-independent protein translocase protein TatA
MFGLGTTELIIIFVVILLLFGGAKLPELARGLGKAIKEFKKAKNEVEDSLKDDEKDSEKK